jgi:2-polyprenyl-6-methoxyphenol hydroxylase-like FAD-dependent oxidoreductase
MGEGYGRLVGNRQDVLDVRPHGARISDVGWTSTFRVSYRQVETYQRDCIYLAGDAAHIHSPAGGMGMNLGMADAATLAWLLATGDEARYTELRHAAGRTVLQQTRGNTRAMTRRGPVTDFMIRHLAPLALSLAPLRRRALRGIAGLDLPATWR